jgi:hypothetical protein
MRPLARRLEFRENLCEAGFMRSESRKMRRMTGLGKRVLARVPATRQIAQNFSEMLKKFVHLTQMYKMHKKPAQNRKILGRFADFFSVLHKF